MSRVITERVEITDKMLKPAKRLIDANALIAEMHNIILEDGEDRRTFYEVIERQPTIEERKWIPCSERLPQPNEEDADGFIKAYLVQDSRWMDVARWNGDCWIAWGYGTALTNVIAWMPLPEPYAERRTDETD